MGLFDSGTTMPALGQQAGFTTQALGERLYLLKPNTPTDRAIISAHGGHKLLSNTNTFTVPTGLTLNFYADDTFSMLDPGFKRFYERNPVPRETIQGGALCFDYILSKYQGGHNKMGETYGSIARVINTAGDRLEQFDKDIFLSRISMDTRSEALLGQYRARVRVAAVVTVRNRHFMSAMTLQALLTRVRAAEPQITTFDCSFCRSTAFGGNQPVAFV